MLYAVPKTQPANTLQNRVKQRLRATRQSDILQCPNCEGRELMETVTGVALVNGKPKGGARTMVCAACHREGRRVVVA